MIKVLKRPAPAADRDDALELPGWSRQQWDELYAFTTERTAKAGEVLITRGETERTLYFVTDGELEVVTLYGDGQSMGPLSRVGAGSVVGEQSFFDRLPRSASVWAIRPTRLRRLCHDDFQAYSQAHPERARELLFALAQVLSIRLRHTTERARR